MPTCRSDTLAFMLATASAVGEGRLGNNRHEVERAKSRAVNQGLYKHIWFECTEKTSG